MARFFSLVSLLAQAQASWNDTLCHNPSEPNCNPCFDNLTNSVKQWSGGTDFPAVKPWYNSMGSGPAHPGTGTCSQCMDRDMDDFRGMLASKPLGCDCSSGGPWPSMPCSAPAPGLFTCDCYCAYEGGLTTTCGIDTSVVNYPGPCALVRARATAQGKPFVMQCDYDGYYNVKQTGPGPNGGTSDDTKTWCTDPTNGQQNVSTVVPAAQGATLNCTPTIQCQLMNTFRCQRPEFHTVCWWLQDVGPWHGHLCQNRASADETYEEAVARAVADFHSSNATRAR